MITLGIDIGTSGVQVVAVDEDGKLVHEVNRRYPLLTPQAGWTEQKPQDWAQETLAALKEMAETVSGDIGAIGLSGQMHGMVPLDAKGEVVRPAILWNDQRTGEAVAEINQRVPRDIMIQRTGNPAITGFHVCKLIWLRNEEPENFARTKHSLLPKDYIGYVLTGEMASEPSDNSGTNCFHIESKTWDEEILGRLELPLTLFPQVIASHDTTGKLNRDIATQTGLPEGIPVIAGAGDNAAAATGLGLSSRRPELGSVSLGTSGVVFAPLKEAKPDPEGRVHLFCHADGGYNLLGVTLSAAGSLSWYRDTFAPDKSFDELVDLVAASEPGSKGVTFKPYLSGERTPHLNPDLRGSFTGLNLTAKQGDIVRSVLEGVAFSLRDALDIITPLAKISQALVTGGGAKSQTWLQIVADVLELPLQKPSQNLGAAYGAALLAAQGIGLVEDATAVSERAQSAVIEPADTSYEDALAAYRNVPLMT